MSMNYSVYVGPAIQIFAKDEKQARVAMDRDEDLFFMPEMEGSTRYLLPNRQGVCLDRETRWNRHSDNEAALLSDDLEPETETAQFTEATKAFCEGLGVSYFIVWGVIPYWL